MALASLMVATTLPLLAVLTATSCSAKLAGWMMWLHAGLPDWAIRIPPRLVRMAGRTWISVPVGVLDGNRQVTCSHRVLAQHSFDGTLDEGYNVRRWLVH